MNRKKYPVELMPKTLGVSKSGFYKWLSSNDLRVHDQTRVDNKIEQEFNNSKQTYGSPRVAMELNKKGIVISKTTVGRRMK